ncbi:ATP-binding protein [Photobacterium kishitanii]|uniref:Uncharacterized protein n=1 Tax=Photobacterium kishitanii TaxID=318456 RepID=A0A2T3KMC6_9GAMM|nr:ATP-binding protein [Photobacterium kishitanii]PSV00938.1 hypothetical protein C9J27_02630 [Photobacterium kishitanii]
MSGTVESLKWSVDSDGIIGHLIESQNGTLSAAVKELIMNLVDKGSTKCEITLRDDYFSVVDNGIGFVDREDVENHFGCFGKRHEEGDAVYGRFRIGRGQIMSLAKVTWHSHEFKMTADYKKNSGGYELEVNQNEYVDGCTVYGQLYNVLTSWDFKNTVDEIKTFTKYMDVEVVLNGSILNSSITDVKWDYEDDDVMIKWEPKRQGCGVFVYSKGVFVKEISSYIYGLDSDVVTKKTLVLNMARNEIAESDPTWGKITTLLKAEAVRRAKHSKRKISEAQRLSLINQIICGDYPLSEAMDLKLFKDSRGVTFSFSAFKDRLFPITMSPNNHPLADHIASSKSATVFDVRELSRWGVTCCEEFLNLLADLFMSEMALCDKQTRRDSGYYLRRIREIRVVAYEKLCKGISSDLKILKTKELSDRDKAARNAIQCAANIMSKRISNILNINVHKRKILIGESQIAHGWTDGETYIAISRDALSFLDAGRYGMNQMALLLLHEYCHDESDVGSHEHAEYFFSKYHDLTMTMDKSAELIGHVASSLEGDYRTQLSKSLLSVPKFCDADPYAMSSDVFILNGKGRLSPFVKKLLECGREANLLDYNKKGKRLTLVSKTSKHFPLVEFLSNMMAEDGIDLPFFDYDSASARIVNNASSLDHHEHMDLIREEYKASVGILIEGWAYEHGHCPKAACEVINSLFSRYSCGAQHLKQVILNDSKTDVAYSESVGEHYKTPVFETDKIKVDYYMPTNIIGERWNCTVSRDELASSKAERVQFVVNSLKNVIGVLKDNDEKRKVLELITSASFVDSIVD